MNIAFIPVRGGSKSIPLKNIKNMNGKPLVYWTVLAACQCSSIDKVYVATDSPLIKETVDNFGFQKVQVIGRSIESASDIASTELAMLEFARHYDFDNIVLIQATSPLLSAQDLDGGFDLFSQEGTDSVLSVVRQKRFIWNMAANGYSEPVNYDVYNRPRRQEFDGYLVENGAFYITRRALLIKSQNRISGKIKAYEMNEDSYFEIDEPSDWNIIEQLMKKATPLESFFFNIKMLVTDCDGVLTDGGMYYSENGDELKKFNTKDGMAFEILRKSGILTGIITGEQRELVKNRGLKLNVDELHMGIKDKISVVKQIAEKHNLALSEIAYVGDDINDLSCIRQCGFSACPNDAYVEVRKCADYVCNAAGGQGVIREVADLLLKRGLIAKATKKL